MELGIHTFGELVPDPETRRMISAQERLKQVIHMAVLADEAGLALFGFGEHHRLDFAASAPPVVLAAVAQATKRLRLIGGLPFEKVAQTIELLGSEVLPVVRREIAKASQT